MLGGTRIKAGGDCRAGWQLADADRCCALDAAGEQRGPREGEEEHRPRGDVGPDRRQRGDNSFGAVRKSHASALRALTKAFNKNLRLIFKSIESQMAKDFSQTPAALSTGTCSARAWLCSRSRLGNFQNHVRWSWQVGGILDGWRDRSCPSSSSPSSGSSGPGKHRRRKLGGVNCFSPGAPTSLPRILEAHPPKSDGEPDQCPLRSPVGRDFSWKPQGPRKPQRSEEEISSCNSRARSHGGNQAADDPPGGQPPKSKGKGGKKSEGGSEQKSDK